MPEYDSTIRYAPIPDFPGYMAGSDGTVWSCYWRGPRGKGRGKGSARIMAPSRWHALVPCPRPNGYLAVCMHAAGRQHFLAIHSLVAMTFLGPREAKQQCRHLNGVQTDNRLENLAWGSIKQNHHDKREHGTLPMGESHHNVKLTLAQAQEIKAMHDHGVSVTELCRRFRAGQATVRRIANGEHWSSRPQVTEPEAPEPSRP